MTANIQLLQTYARQRLDRWGQFVTDYISDNPDLGALEHLIHETSHAVLLGYKRITIKTSSLVAGKINCMPKAEKIDQEARTWAVEWQVWQTLDLPFEWGDLIAAAEIQDVHEDEVIAHLNDETEAASAQVIQHLYSLIPLSQRPPLP